MRHASGVPLERVTVDLDRISIELWRATALERFVDVDALLRADAPPEPPYWMHLWPGALALARRCAVAPDLGVGTRVLELGCGLGLPALVAAQRGATTIACDRAREPLRVVADSAADNGCAVACVQMDWRHPALRGGFDYCLGADVGYDRDAEPALVAALGALVRRGGRAVLADSVNTARTSLSDALSAAGFDVRIESQREIEDGHPVWVRVIEARRR
jgi:predicted nicotinamide N-methyase